MTEGTHQDEILTWIEKRIGLAEEFYLPLKKLRQELSEKVEIPIPDLSQLKEWLEKDGRFDLVEPPPEMGGYPPEEEKEMEKHGFFRGCRVGLKKRRPTPEQIKAMLEKHASRLIDSLQKAYEARPRDGEDKEEIEDKLLELLQEAKKLKQGLPEIINNTKKPSD